jgi:ferritin-like protein
MYHEPVEELQQQTRDVTRALQSMKEELEAIDWYNQRAAATQDQSLKNLLIHNRDEEIEHATMLVEWLRRLMPEFDEEMRTYLFTQGPLETLEEAAEGQSPQNSSGDLGIGKTR